jgi:hypothetical protein
MVATLLRSVAVPPLMDTDGTWSAYMRIGQQADSLRGFLLSCATEACWVQDAVLETLQASRSLGDPVRGPAYNVVRCF